MLTYISTIFHFGEPAMKPYPPISGTNSSLTLPAAIFYRKDKKDKVYNFKNSFSDLLGKVFVLFTVFLSSTMNLKAADFDFQHQLTKVADTLVAPCTPNTDGDTCSVEVAIFNPQQSYILTGAKKDGSIRLWDLNGNQIWSTGVLAETECAAFTLDGNRIFTGGEDGKITVRNSSDGSIVTYMIPPTNPVSIEGIMLSPDGTILAVGDENGVLSLWNTSNYTLIRSVQHGPDSNDGVTEADINSVSFSPDGLYIVSGSRQKNAKLWRVSDLALIRTYTGHTGSIKSVRISPDGTKVVTGSFDQTAKVYNYSDGTLLATLQPYFMVEAVEFTPDSAYIFVGGQGADLQIYKNQTGFPWAQSLRQYDHEYISFTKDGTYLLTANEDGTFRLLLTRDKLSNETFNNHSTGIRPAGWTIPSGAPVTVEAVPSASDKSLFINNSSAYVGHIDTRKTFPVQTSGTVVVQFKFRMSQTNNNLSLGHLEDAANSMLTTLYYDATVNKIRYHSGGTLYDLPGASGLVANTWYTIKIVANVTNKTQSIFYEDMVTPKVSNVNFRTNGNPEKIKFSVNDLSGSDVSAYFDNILVYKQE
jgi:WD40 repeat protein